MEVLVLTDRDWEIVAWVARFRFVTVAQIGRRFAMKVGRVYRRLDAWREAGMAEHRRPFRAHAGAVWATPRACRAMGLGEVRTPSLELVSVRHELALVDLGIEYELRLAAGHRIVTEREMRRAERLGERWSVALDTSESERARRRWPDLACEEGSVRTALEVEFAAKRSSRLRAILLGYQAADHYERVRFVVERATVAQRLARLACDWGSEGALLAVQVSKLELAPWDQSPERDRIATIAEEHRARVSGDAVGPDGARHGARQRGSREAVQLMFGR